MGRPAKPIELHQLHGTKSQSKAAAESHVQAGRPKMPADIRTDAGLRETFKRIVKLLGERRALSAGDVDLIRLFCFAYERHAENVKLLRTEGCLTEYTRLDSHGEPHTFVGENKRFKHVTSDEKQMASILSQLGLSPTAKDRARPTSGIPASDVVPGSIEAEHPEWFKDGKYVGGNVTPFVMPEPLQPEPETEEEHVIPE